MAKFTVTTLGCKVNQSESAAIAESLENSGWAAQSPEGNADLCIINTCTVTQKAAMQSRQAVRQAIRANPAARIIVTGCYAQTEAEALKKISGVDLIVGHTHKHKIPELVIAPGKEPGDAPVSFVHPIGEMHLFEPLPAHALKNRTRPVLKIQDGCNACCSYCIVPYARGRSRSLAPELALENIERLKQAGFHEIVLSGIHLGSYGLDLPPPTNLHHFLERIQENQNSGRFRLSSIEPHELTDDIIGLVAGSERFCRHFHIPLQSGDNRVLRKMRRPYTGDYFKRLIGRIIRSIPGAAVGVDILVGFPGETEAAFENTYALIEELPVTYLHVFPFSPRRGTPAADFPGRVPEQTVQARCRRMRNLGYAKKEQFYINHIGQAAEVLVESTRDSRCGLLKGISSNYISVLIDGDDSLKNSLINVKLEKLHRKAGRLYFVAA